MRPGSASGWSRRWAEALARLGIDATALVDDDVEHLAALLRPRAPDARAVAGEFGDLGIARALDLLADDGGVDGLRLRRDGLDRERIGRGPAGVLRKRAAGQQGGGQTNDS